MRIASLIARYLMALIFVVFGSNHLFNFLPQPPPPPGVAGQFFHILMSTGYLYVVGVCEVVPGILLLVNRFVPLALLILGPVIVNISRDPCGNCAGHPMGPGCVAGPRRVLANGSLRKGWETPFVDLLTRHRASHYNQRKR
jgi:DoxX-like protein